MVPSQLYFRASGTFKGLLRSTAAPFTNRLQAAGWPVCPETHTALAQGSGGPPAEEGCCGDPPAAPATACLASLLAGLFAERRQLRAALAELDAFCRQGGAPRCRTLGFPRLPLHLLFPFCRRGGAPCCIMLSRPPVGLSSVPSAATAGALRGNFIS